LPVRGATGAANDVALCRIYPIMAVKELKD